ncbi:MAG: TolC family protein [Acidobacteria bacterium]|nr:MAG: TolC family protein [Acidobacteriota bacterium]
MTKMARAYWVACGVGVVMAIGAGRASAQSAPVSLSLEDALARGKATAPRLAEAVARQQAAAATVTSREAMKRPTVSASAAYQRTNHVEEYAIPQAGGGLRVLFPDIPNNYRGRADAAMPLYTGGRIEALVASAEADKLAADADLKTAGADAALDVARAYWSLVTAREAERVVEQGLRRMDAYVSDVKARVDAGVLPPNDLLSAQAQRARQSVALIQARNAASVAQSDLCRLVGLDLDTTILPTASLMAPIPSVAAMSALPINAMTEQARAGRTERDALTRRAEAARAAGDASRAALRPQISVSGGVEESRPNARIVPRVDAFHSSWEAGVGVTWQLFDGGKGKADRAAAAAQATALERRRDDFDAMLGVELRQRRGDVEAGKAALAASAEAVSAATEARRVITERFKAGVATSTDVLDAENALLEAELERTRLAAALRLSEARLLRAVGGE